MEKAANMAGSALVLPSLFHNLVFFSSRNEGAASPPPPPDHSPMPHAARNTCAKDLSLNVNLFSPL